MSVYLTTWTAFKLTSNMRQLVVSSDWNLTGKDIQLRSISNKTLDNEVILEYEVTEGSVTGKVHLDDDVFLDKPWNTLPAGHKIIIQSYENNVMQDNEEMLTNDAHVL